MQETPHASFSAKPLRLITFLAIVLLSPACALNTSDQASYDADEMYLDEGQNMDEWIPEDPLDLQGELNVSRAPWAESPRFGERCNPTPRYLTKHEHCVGCDGVCLAVEWPLGAKMGHYAFTCVSNAELSSYPDALEGRKTSLCRQQAGGLFSLCSYMTDRGWYEIYFYERKCVVGSPL